MIQPYLVHGLQPVLHPTQADTAVAVYGDMPGKCLLLTKGETMMLLQERVITRNKKEWEK